MSQEAVERVLGRLITDEGFRRLASYSLEAAILQEGYRLNPVELQLLSGLELQSIAEIAGRLNPGLCRVGLALKTNRSFYPSVEAASVMGKPA